MAIRTVRDLMEELADMPATADVKFEALNDFEQGDLAEAQGVDLRLSLGGVIVTLDLPD